MLAAWLAGTVAGLAGGEVDPPASVDLPEGGRPELVHAVGWGEDDLGFAGGGGDGLAAPDCDVVAGGGEQEIAAVDGVEGDEGVGVGEDGICWRGVRDGLGGAG